MALLPGWEGSWFSSPVRIVQDGEHNLTLAQSARRVTTVPPVLSAKVRRRLKRKEKQQKKQEDKAHALEPDWLLTVGDYITAGVIPQNPLCELLSALIRDPDDDVTTATTSFMASTPLL